MKRVLTAIVCFVMALSFAAFAEAASDFEYEVEDGEATITGYTGAGGDVTIPSTIGGYSVTKIFGNAFADCTEITSIVIPDSVKDIRQCAFSGCTSLASITIPDSVEIIGGDVFSNTAYSKDCANWDNGILYVGKHICAAASGISGEVIIRDGTVGISESAFYDRRNITSITVPDSLISIGTGAFDYSGYYLDAANWVDGVLYVGKNLYAARYDIQSDYTVKDGTVNICGLAFFRNSNLTSIVIPDSVKKIGNSAFYNCTALTSVTMGSGVTRIGNLAFADCVKLTSITVPDNVTYIDYGAFGGSAMPDSVTIGKSVTKICEYAFFNCINLNKVSVYNGSCEISFTQEGETKSFAIPQTVTIYGYAGSTAEEYSVKNGNNFVAFGDVDLSGGVTIADALVLFKHVAGVELIEGSDALYLADIDGKDGITISDALTLFKLVAGVISEI